MDHGKFSLHQHERQEFAPLVVGVGGGGCDLNECSIAFRMVRSTLEEADIAHAQIHGVDDLFGEAQVVPASLQESRIAELVDDSPEAQPILLVAQCMGGIAVANYLTQVSARENVQGVIFSPATQPGKTLTYPRSRAVRHENDTIMRIKALSGDVRTYDIAVDEEIDAHLPPEYLEEAHQAHDMMDKLKNLVNLGKLSLWATEGDWNKDSPVDVAHLQAEVDSHQQSRLHIVPGVRHSLNPVESTPQSTRAQKELVEHIVHTELAILSSQAT